MKIYAPNRQYTGVSASVPFAAGVGETDNPHLIEWFKARGYGIGEELPHEAPTETVQPAKDPEVKPAKKETAYTVAELHDKLTAAGVGYPKSANKDMLVKIAEANGVSV